MYTHCMGDAAGGSSSNPSSGNFPTIYRQVNGRLLSDRGGPIPDLV